MSAKQVLVAYDFSGAADVAVERGLELASRSPDHILHFIVVVEPRRAADAREIQQQVLERIGAVLNQRPPGPALELVVHARIGAAAEEILGLARELDADLIVIGADGLGATSAALVRGAGCPVIVARAKAYPPGSTRRAPAKRIRPLRFSFANWLLQVRSAFGTLH